VEQLYSFPEIELRTLIGSYPALEEVVWVQEEPQNMGAWTYIRDRLGPLLPEDTLLRYAGRPERASPAEGYPGTHQAEQARLVADALAPTG
jgi:2-oxoglutarate dehydrogenase E1 component